MGAAGRRAGRRRSPRVVRPLAAGLLGAGLLVAAAGPAAAERFRPAPGTVIVRDSMGGWSTVVFHVPAAAPIGRREIAAAAAAAGLPNDGVEEHAHGPGGVRELRLRTTVATRTSWLSRRIDGRVLGHLDVFGQGRLVLQLHPWARVTQGQARPLESSVLARRYALEGEADVGYRVPAAAMAWALLALLALALVPAAILRAYAGRVTGRDLDTTEKVHRLRAALLAAMLLLPLGLLPALFLGGLVLLPEVLLGGLAPGAARSQAAVAAASVLFLLAVVAGVLLPAVGAVAPAYRRLRGVQATRASRVGNLRLGLAMLLPALLLLVVNVPAVSDPAVRLGLLLLGWVVVIAGAPPLAIRLMPARPLEEPLQGRLQELLRRGGVRVRGIRVLDTRSQKVANALIMGLVPRLRYILITDYLLQRLQQDEVEAIVAHEMGHAKQHHLLVKLAAVLVLAFLFVAAAVVGGRLLEVVDPAAVAFAVPLALVLCLLLVQGGLGLLLERRADDYAARLVGVDPVVRALDKVAESNMLKRRTGALWNLATHHPGIAQRVDRLQGRYAEQAAQPGRT